MNIEFEEGLRHVVSGWQDCERVLHVSPARFTEAASPVGKRVRVKKRCKCAGVKKCKKPHTRAGASCVSCSNEPVMSFTGG